MNVAILVKKMGNVPISGRFGPLRRGVDAVVGDERVEPATEAAARRQGGSGRRGLPLGQRFSVAVRVVALVDPVDAAEDREKENPSYHRGIIPFCGAADVMAAPGC